MGFARVARMEHGLRWVAVTLILGGLVLFGFGSRAEAAPGCAPGALSCPPLLTEFGEFGSVEGQLRRPSAIAADPVTGHIFIAGSGTNFSFEETRIDQFDSKGDFVKAWGWGVLDGSPELQVCTNETGCMGGQQGPGAGQISNPFGIVVDEGSNVWVLEFSNRRLQKFSPEGDFLLMVGGEVNKTAVEEREEQEVNAEPMTVTEAEENLCTAASGDVCGVGKGGTGKGEFGIVGFNDPLALGPDGTIYVGDVNRIQKFDEEGNFEGEIPLPGAGKTESLTVTPDGRIYVINSEIFQKVGGLGNFEVNSWVVREIGPAGEELDRLIGEWEGKKTPKDPAAVTSDAEGNVYISARVVYALPLEGGGTTFKEFREVVAFDAAGNLISFEPDLAGFGRPTDATELISLATNVVKGTDNPGEAFVGHYLNGAFSGKPSLAYVRSYGIPFEDPESAPEITDQYLLSATDSEATVEALINPRFTTGTTYQVEYGATPCSAGGCESVAPIPPAQLGGGAVNTPQKASVELTGLEPGTTYHFRFRAENKVTGEEESGPAFGEEGTFRTFRTFSREDCANDPLRLGPAADLPDCRAYEMVSPVDKDGGEILVLTSVPGFPAEINQGASSGDALTYSSYRAFADPDAAPFTSQYLAKRDPAKGWLNESISPPREGTIVPGLETQYRVFTEDLSQSWLVTDSEPVLAEDGLPGYRNLYRRDNDTGAYQAQCAAEPEGNSAFDYRLEPQGYSADGSHLVYRAEGKLTPDAAPIGKTPQLYECVNGDELRLVSILPGGEASPAGGSAGTSDGGLGGFGLRVNSVTGAISDDGSRIFWTAAATGPGPLYVRINGTETVQVAAAGASFRAASPEGDRVIYSVGDDLFEASVEPEAATSTQVAGEVDGVMGMSEDTKLVYLVSKEDLDSGIGAEAGKPNLYLYRSEEDSFTFIAILSEEDAREAFSSASEFPALTPVARSPYNRSSRVSADGLHAAFTSSAELTGFDNRDQATGETLTEVFIYDAMSEELACASCNPTNARPQGKNIGTSPNPYWTAAYIPGFENQLHASRALSEGGNRLLFNAIDPLALGDTNGKQDVYEWQAPGSGSCTLTSSTYSPANEGCIDLVTTGKSPQPSELVDASATGGDVFFKTAQSLWPLDPGLVDIYDARVGGGFPPPPPDVPVCISDCQPRGPEPVNVAPSTALPGPGNVVEKPKPKRCRKGTHRVRKAGKVRCVKNKRKAKAGTSRRQSR